MAMIEELGKRIKASYTHFAADFAENPTTYFTRVLLVLFFSGMLTIMMFVFPEKIREEQIDSLVYADITSTKLQPLVLSDASKTIAENKAISVMFCVPKGKQYETLLAIFNDPKEMEELNRPIYFYPLIYDIKETEQKYKINQEKPTVIFFKDGKEANRLTIEKKDNQAKLAQEMIPELNRLPLANIKKLEDEMAKSESASTKITEDQANTTTRSTDDN
ncbi:hypothetical protein ABQE22_05080 [Enterococcus durans]|nr:hypothetical protein [Enterococcus durans]MBE8847714.1 hypothetical protein [Enterococcus durans]WCG28839.1 hypothetical protein PML98_06420 [Enterococcus durans]WCG70401.1 hypothetical protein PML92_06430 [Enterococcus durans]